MLCLVWAAGSTAAEIASPEEVMEQHFIPTGLLLIPVLTLQAVERPQFTL